MTRNGTTFLRETVQKIELFTYLREPLEKFIFQLGIECIFVNHFLIKLIIISFFFKF
jgi:hypothetical protein